jgi:ribosomal protein S17
LSHRTEIARVRTTARVKNEGEEVEATETAPISEMMKCSGLVVREEEESVPTKDVVVEVEPTVAEAKSDDEEDDDILNPSKPSHIDFEKSTVKAGDLVLMKKLGYFGENDDELVQFAGKEVVLEPRNDEVVVLRASS